MTDNPIPRRVHRDDREIVITWDDDHVGHYPARDLRLGCQCATCREELTGQPLLDPASVPADVRPLAVQLVGSYAMRIDWSDGHRTGIYTWRYLKAMCPCGRCTGEGGASVEGAGAI